MFCFAFFSYITYFVFNQYALECTKMADVTIRTVSFSIVQKNCATLDNSLESNVAINDGFNVGADRTAVSYTHLDVYKRQVL